MSDPCASDAWTRQVQQEKQVEANLLAHEQQWFQDGKNAQVEAGTASKHITEAIKEVQSIQEKYNP